MSRLACSSFLILGAALAIGCGTSSTPSDAGIDAFRPPVDAGVPDDGGPPDGGCDLGAIPGSLPEIAGSFAVDEPDGGMPPASTGGDETGTFVFDDATFWVQPAAAAMFDPSTSTVTGTAWASFEGGEARIDFRFVTTLMGTVAGTIVRPSSTQILGTYELATDGSTIMIDPICAQSSAMMAMTDGGTMGMAGLTFTRTGDDMTLISRLSGAAGTITIVLEGTRRTP